ncbi:pentatricopeptide repeat-containing protein At4g21190 isoform X2 [Neltuma alba]|uniref:pentatricopeptide repeat-containing protein At4g21190 isoform X2 n=1 Tax=Neltuma alba TaxID=207710 RepID=UPI0010A4B788|nr:pentatricopeptide repeat-containing protein At4g21190 isoform X2 [Prosopis alba]
MLALTDSPLFIIKTFEAVKIPTSTRISVVCAAKGPRPRYPRVWKTKRKIGTISKAAKLVQNIKELSNVKEEVYGALDSFVAWELEFPLITVKKALKTLEEQQEWKRVIQVTKWMLSKGQGRTMGSYFTLLNALAEDDRLDEAEELWTKLLMQNLESLPRRFFDKMISIYYKRGKQKKMFEIFADMEELGIRNVFKELGMLDKYEKLIQKYPPPKWEYRYIRGKRVRIKVGDEGENNQLYKDMDEHEEDDQDGRESEGEGLEQRPEVIHEEFQQDNTLIYDETEQNTDEIEQTEQDVGVQCEKAEIRSNDSL